MKVSIPIKPYEKSGINHNLVQAYVTYDKKSSAVAGPVLQMTAMENDGSGFLKTALFSSPTERLRLASDWKANSKKKIDALNVQLQEQVDARAGELYAHVEQFLAGNGLELAEVSAAVTV